MSEQEHMVRAVRPGATPRGASAPKVGPDAAHGFGTDLALDNVWGLRRPLVPRRTATAEVALHPAVMRCLTPVPV